MQLDPGYPMIFAVDPTLAFRHFSGNFREFQLLKLKHDKLLSNVACNCKPCRDGVRDEALAALQESAAQPRLIQHRHPAQVSDDPMCTAAC